MIDRSFPGSFPLDKKKLVRRVLRAAASSLPGVTREAVVDLLGVCPRASYLVCQRLRMRQSSNRYVTISDGSQ